MGRGIHLKTIIRNPVRLSGHSWPLRNADLGIVSLHVRRAVECRTGPPFQLLAGRLYPTEALPL